MGKTDLWAMDLFTCEMQNTGGSGDCLEARTDRVDSALQYFPYSLSPFVGNVHNFTSQIQIQQLIKQTEGRVPDLADWAEQSLQGA